MQNYCQTKHCSWTSFTYPRHRLLQLRAPLAGAARRRWSQSRFSNRLSTRTSRASSLFCMMRANNSMPSGPSKVSFSYRLLSSKAREAASFRVLNNSVSCLWMSSCRLLQTASFSSRLALANNSDIRSLLHICSASIASTSSRCLAMMSFFSFSN